MTQEPTKEITLHFFIKEEGKLYYLPEVPERPFKLNPVIQDIGLQQKYERDHNQYQSDIQALNSIQVGNNELVKNWISNDIGCQPFQYVELQKDTIYSLTGNYSVEIKEHCCAKGFPFHCEKGYCIHKKRIALISLKPEVKEPFKISNETISKQEVLKKHLKSIHLERSEETFQNICNAMDEWVDIVNDDEGNQLTAEEVEPEDLDIPLTNHILKAKVVATYKRVKEPEEQKKEERNLYQQGYQEGWNDAMIYMKQSLGEVNK